MGIFSKNNHSSSEEKEATYGSLFMTFAQALAFNTQMPSAVSLPQYMELFDSFLLNTMSEGTISAPIYQMIKYSPYGMSFTESNKNIYKLSNFDQKKYFEQGAVILNKLAPWKENWSVTNQNQMEIFTDLAVACETLGMDKNDDETLGLIFTVSLYFTTVLKDSQQNRRTAMSIRDTGAFFGSEILNLWLLKKLF